MSKKHFLGVIYAVIAAVLWGVLAVVLKMTGSFLPSADVVWFRMSLSFLSLLLFYLFYKPQKIKILIKPPLLLIIAGLFLAANYIGYMEGIHFTTPANAQIFIQSGPLLLAVAGIIFFKERLNWYQILGFIIAILGFSVYYLDQSVIANSPSYAKGIGLVLMAGVTWAVYAALQKKLIVQYAAQQLNLVIYFISALVFFPFVKMSGFHGLTGFQWGILIFTYLNTLISYACIAQALKYLEANKVSSIIILNPILTFAIMASFQWFEVSWVKAELFTIYSVIGALLVLVGALMVLLLAEKRKLNPEFAKGITNNDK